MQENQVTTSLLTQALMSVVTMLIYTISVISYE